MAQELGMRAGWIWTLALVGCELHLPASPAIPPAADAVGERLPAPRAPLDSVVAEMQAHPLDYTHHARCRMSCRHIDEDDVSSVLSHGERDPSRTRTDGRCPSHALHGSEDGRRLRVVYAACETETLVVTVIDLDKEWDCACD